MRRFIEVAVGNGTPNGARRDGLAIEGDRIDDGDRKCVLSTQCAEQANAPFPSPTQAVVVSDKELAHPIARDQELLNEFSSTERGERGREGEDDDIIDARLGKGFDPFDARGEEQWCGRRIDDFQRMRLKGDDEAGQPAIGRASDQSGEQISVAAVHTVEGADGRDRAFAHTGEVDHSRGDDVTHHAGRASA